MGDHTVRMPDRSSSVAPSANSSGQPQTPFVGDLAGIIRIRASELYTGGTPEDALVVREGSDERTAVRLEFDPQDEYVDVLYRSTRLADGSAREERYALAVSWAEQTFGERARLECSAVGCRRVGDSLFLRIGEGPYLYCGNCVGLSYRRRRVRLSHEQTLAAKSRALRSKLGGVLDLRGPVPPRPRGMHGRTYRRYLAELRDIEMELMAAAVYRGELRVRQLLAREFEYLLAERAGETPDRKSRA